MPDAVFYPETDLLVRPLSSASVWLPLYPLLWCWSCQWVGYSCWASWSGLSVSIIAAHRRQWLEVRRQRKERSFLLLPATLWQLLEVVANSCRNSGLWSDSCLQPPKLRQHLSGFQNNSNSSPIMHQQRQSPSVHPGALAASDPLYQSYILFALCDPFFIQPFQHLCKQFPM